MAISPVQTLEVPDVCHRWLENRGTVYELLIDFLGNWPSLSMIAEWSRGSGISKAAECSKAGTDLMKYLCGRSPEELVRICEYEGRNTVGCFSSPNLARPRNPIIRRMDALRIWPSVMHPPVLPLINCMAKRTII